MNQVRRLAMVAPGNTPTPPVMTRVGSALGVRIELRGEDTG